MSTPMDSPSRSGVRSDQLQSVRASQRFETLIRLRPVRCPIRAAVRVALRAFGIELETGFFREFSFLQVFLDVRRIWGWTSSRAADQHERRDGEQQIPHGQTPYKSCYRPTDCRSTAKMILRLGIGGDCSTVASGHMDPPQLLRTPGQSGPIENSCSRLRSSTPPQPGRSGRLTVPLSMLAPAAGSSRSRTAPSRSA